MKMKKLIASAVMTGILATGASAANIHSYIGASYSSGSMKIGQSYSEHFYGLRYGVYGVLKHGIFWGVNFFGKYGKIPSLNADEAQYGMDLDLGYRVMEKIGLDIYGIGTMFYGNIGNENDEEVGNDIVGYGYGIGAGMNLFSRLRLIGEYKIYPKIESSIVTWKDRVAEIALEFKLR
jgi:opacity protein-like surface antigen